jgi:hypothetical protein
VYRKLAFEDGLPDQAMAGRNAAFNEAGTQFNAIGSAFTRSNTGLQRFCADLKLERHDEEA